MNKPIVLFVHSSPTHSMAKIKQPEIRLIEGIGIEGDVHSGPKVKHRSRISLKPIPPNLRQVHFIHAELIDELEQKGFSVWPGQMGENITTRGIDLLNLPEDTILRIGKGARVKVTGLRNPCSQLDGIQKGLMKAVLDKDKNGNLLRKTGIMSIVLKSGIIKPGDEIFVELPPQPHRELKPV